MKKEGILGCGECNRKLPASQFPKHKRGAPALANVTSKRPCLECMEASKKSVIKEVQQTRQENGYKVVTLKPAFIGSPYDLYSALGVSSTSYSGTKL